MKDFLTHAYESWQSPAPQYVLLVGDTSYDYKDNWGAGTVNLVPGYLIYTTHLGETITRRVVRPGQRRGRGGGSLHRPAAGGNPCPGAGDGRQDRGLRECLQLQELGADAGAVGGQPGRELGGGVRDDERGRGRTAARGHGDARAVLPAGVREREPRGDGPDRGAAVCGGGRGAGGELRGPRQREPLGDRAGPGQPGRGVPVGRLDADQLRHVPVRGEHELSDGLLHLPADRRLRGGLVAVAGRGVVVAGVCGRGGGADAHGDDGHRGSAPAVQCALRGDLHAGPPDAGPGGGLRAAAAVGQRGLAVRADEQHVHVLRGPGDRAEGAAAAAAAGVDGGVAGRRPGGVGLECGARLRRGRGRGLPPLPAQRRRSELHAGDRGAARGAELHRRGGGRGGGRSRLLLRALPRWTPPATRV